MQEIIQPVITKVGKIKGRDAIYLDKINLTENQLELNGEFNTTSCSLLNISDNKFIPYTIKFYNYVFLKLIELDFYETEYKSPFDEIINSNQIKKMLSQNNPKINNTYRHFVFRTYDTIFEIICKDFDLTV